MGCLECGQGVWGGGANGELLSSNTPSAGVCACGRGVERVVSDGRHTGQVAYNDEEWELDLPITGSSGCGHKFEQSWRHKCGKNTHKGRPSIFRKLSFLESGVSAAAMIPRGKRE